MLSDQDSIYVLKAKTTVVIICEIFRIEVINVGHLCDLLRGYLQCINAVFLIYNFLVTIGI
ncbi:hypothetical protein GCM10023206_30000 [Acinetobacter puyangensis]